MIDPALADLLQQNVAAVRSRVERAAADAGRDPSSVRLIAVSKTFPADHVRAAALAGQRDFGENKVQEGLDKIAEVADPALQWHLIGHLQSNKARKAVGQFAAIHSVDSLELLRRLGRAATDAGTVARLLVQVDLAGEATKFGAPAHEAEQMLRAELAGVEITGLMLLPPWSDDPESARPWFQKIAALRARWLDAGIAPARLAELSMGMSHDFEVAIAEGSTMVRVGTAIFGARVPQHSHA